MSRPKHFEFVWLDSQGRGRKVGELSIKSLNRALKYLDRSPSSISINGVPRDRWVSILKRELKFRDEVTVIVRQRETRLLNNLYKRYPNMEKIIRKIDGYISDSDKD